MTARVIWAWIVRRRSRPLLRACVFVLAALAAAVSQAGCALMFTGPKDSLPIDSEPQGAEVIVDGVPAGTTPLTINVASGDDHVIVLRRPGFRDQTVRLTRGFEGGYLVLDIIFTALIGVVVDAATGAWWYASPDNVSVVLSEGAQESRP